MTTGQRIAEKRREHNLSQEALGEALGVSRQSIYKWEADASLPEIDKLVALSRLFEVPVGWLLGVEDIPEAAPGEFTEEQIRVIEEIFARYQHSAPAGELSQEQREQVEALVAEQMAARPKKKRRWPWVLAAAVVLFFAWTALSSWVDQLNNRFNSLSSSINEVSHDVNQQIGSISGRVEDILKAQNSLAAEYVAQCLSLDVEGNTALFSASITPKTYAEGLEVVFQADCGDGSVTQVPGTDDGNHRFSAQITCPLTNSITLSAVLVDGGIRQTQLLDTFSDLYSSTFPEVDLDYVTRLWGERRAEDGLFHLGGAGDFQIGIAVKQRIVYSGEDPVLQDGLDVQVGLFRNRELVAWMEETKKNELYDLPAVQFAAEDGDSVCFAARITDRYDRQWMSIGVPACEVQDGELELVGGDYSASELYDPANWTF